MKIRMRADWWTGARVATSPGADDNGAAFVEAHISKIDEFGDPVVVGTLQLTPDEARDLAARLIKAAGKQGD